MTFRSNIAEAGPAKALRNKWPQAKYTPQCKWIFQKTVLMTVLKFS